MTLTSRSLAIILFVMLFGGIAFASAMGWWVTESTKVPVTFAEGEFAGQPNPADIRGSYTFGDIANSFDVTPTILAQAFGIQADDPTVFAVKELETIYVDSGYEIGTASVRLFVAYYTGLPFDTSSQEIYLPQSATDLLLQRGNLTSDQMIYLEKSTVPTSASAQIETTEAHTESPTDSTAYLVKGKTTFGELRTWGVSKAVIEGVIHAPMPDPAMTVKEYASANGLDFEILKPALQAEVDKIRP